MRMKTREFDPIQVTIVGCGGMARHHLSVMLAEFETTHIPVVCEPSLQQFEATAAKFEAAGRVPPENEPDLDRLLQEYGDQLDAAFIITPHVLHHDQALACMEAGLDVLLEKPMVMNVAEAKSLIDARDRLGRLLVVAFNGSLSPEIRTASAMIQSGDIGELQSISATIWQNWRYITGDTWRQVPQSAGGGFMFDTWRSPLA